MVDETTKKEEKALSLLEEIKKTKVEVEEANKLAAEQISELRELKANEILSGKADAGQEPEKPAEKTNRQIAEDALKGIV